jgi:ribosome-binding factor A
MHNKRVSDIKRAQKTSLFLRAITTLFSQLTADNEELRSLYVNRIELTPDKSVCYVLFYSPLGIEEFNKKLSFLILYKPSLRAALAKEINGRYTPEIVFKYDEAQERVDRIDTLLQNLKDKGEL